MTRPSTARCLSQAARRFPFTLALLTDDEHLAGMKNRVPSRRAGSDRWDPIRWLSRGVRVLGKSLSRLWGRDVMLYVGGVSFFAMLAAFPGLAIMVGLYSLLSDPNTASEQAQAIARLMPSSAATLFKDEFIRLSQAPLQAVSTQSGLALIIGGYAAHRGFKALLAGLSFIHEEDKPRGFFGFNLMALLVLIAAVLLLAILSAVFFYLRFISAAFGIQPLKGLPWISSEWVWSSLGITLAMSLIYRFAMSSKPVAWRASIIGGAAAAVLCLLMSWGSAFYVEQIAHLGATYGSVAAAIVFLIWLSWNVNAIFFGGALATEIEIASEAVETTPSDGTLDA